MSNSPESAKPAASPTRLACEGVGYEVWIAVEGKEVPIYAREYNESKKEVTCWVESEAGKRFSIMYKSTIDGYAMGMKTFLDGCLANESLLLPRSKNLQQQMNCVRTSQSAGQHLTFGLLELTDDDAYLNQSLKSENFGEIRIVVDKKSSFVQTNQENLPIFKLIETEKVHERAKKGLTHQIKPGATLQMQRPEIYNAVSAGTLATFTFRYRTLAMLQANGIIAPDPTSSTSQERSQPPKDAPPVKRELSEEQSDDDDGMGEREKALLAELEEIRQKKRAKDSGGSSRKKIKTESDAPKSYFKPGEVIDLTDDAPRAKTQPKRKGREMKREILDLTL